MFCQNRSRSLTSARARRRRIRRAAAQRRLSLETLEDRRVLSYSVIDLGTLGAGTSRAMDINASAQVVGSTDAPGGTRAFLWQNGLMTDLGTLGGGYSSATGINDAGQVVGESNTSTTGFSPSHAFLITPEDTNGDGAPDRWFRDTNADGRNDLMRDLGTLGGITSTAYDVNNSGQVVGASWNGSGQRAFVWQSGVMSDLGTLGGATSTATAINDLGQATGWSTTVTGESHVFLWRNGIMTDLGRGLGQDINSSGQVGGFWSPTWRSMAGLWTPTTPNGTTGAVTNVGPLPGSSISSVNGVNVAGEAVGYEGLNQVDENGDYYLYRPFHFANGVLRDLNALQPAGSEWSLQQAMAVNDAGQIVGYGDVFNVVTRQSETHAFLMTPVGLALPLVSVGDVTITEGNNGTSNAVFAVNLSAASTQTVTVHYSTVNGGALAGSDYHAKSGTVTFLPGQIAGTIPVAIIGDRTPESLTESFYVSLSNPGNAILADRVGTGYINDDEPRITVGSVGISEGNTGSSTARFLVTLSREYDQDVTVSYATSNDTATAGSDYVAVSGSITLSRGQTIYEVPVSILGDRRPEPEPYYDPYSGWMINHETSERFWFNLFNPSSNAVAYGSEGIIVDDEPRINFSPVPAAVVEGDSGTTYALVTVELSTIYDQTVTVDYATADSSAIAGSDYLAVSGRLTFLAGQTTLTIPVPVLGDRLGEPDETFLISLRSPSANGIIGIRGETYVTIVDDEPEFLLDMKCSYDYGCSFHDFVTEGDSGTTAASFSIRLAKPHHQTVTVYYATVDVGSAIAGSDFVSTSGSVVFPAGDTAPRLITVPVIGDVAGESEEFFFVNLTSTDAHGPGQFNWYIVDNDPPQINVYDADWMEGNTGSTHMTFYVSLSFATPHPVTVRYATTDGTAAAGSDYRAVSGTLTFPPYETFQAFSVEVIGDRLPEAHETFFVSLSEPTNATIADGQGRGTIYDDEPRISISDVTKKEGRKGQKTQFTFTVTLSTAYDQPVTVSYRTQDGTARSGYGDYVARTGTLTFNPGVTMKTITIIVNGDGQKESNETFFVDLFATNGHSLFDKSRGLGTILNDD